MKKLVSQRNLNVELYREEKGSLLCEATLLDPFHLFRFQMRVEPEERIITMAVAEMTTAPHPECPAVVHQVHLLVGQKIARGIQRKVAETVGGPQGCVHLRELITEAVNFTATALLGYGEGFSIVNQEFRKLSPDELKELGKKNLPGSCHVFPAPEEHRSR